MEQFGDPTNNVHKHPITTLKEVAIGPLSYGSVSSAVEYDGETRYVRITDITDDGALGNDIKSAKKTEDKYLLHEGDILFARTGATVGKTCRYREKYGRAIYAGFLIRLVPNTKLIDPDYLYHFTRSDYYWDFVKSAQRVVAQPNINAQEYGDLKLLLPAMPEQKQFAAFVQQSDKSKFAWLKSQFIEMFGNGLHGNEKFPLSSMKEVCSVIQDGEHSTVKRVDEGHLFLSARNVKLDHNIVLEPVTYVDDERFAKIRKRFAPQAGDVLLTCAGTIGNAAVVPDMEPFVADRGVTMLRPQTGILNSQYLLAFFSSDFAAEQMRRGTKATALAHLYLKQINELRIILPPIDLQNQFADFVKQTDKSK